MGEAEAPLVFDFAEAVEVELADEALELTVPEELRGDFLLHALGVQDVDKFLRVVPRDDFLVLRVLP